MKFHLVSAGSRPLLAIPEHPPGLRAAGAACYPGHTWKKRLVRAAVGLAARSPLLARMCPARAVALGGVSENALEAWLMTLAQSLGFAALHPVLVWPADPGRGRIYLHLLTPDGERVAFCKLGLDAKNNGLIEREGQALSRLHALGLSASRIPAVLALGKVEGLCCLVVETTPPNARSSDWKRDAPITAQIQEFAGQTQRVATDGVASLSWWADTQNHFADNPSFLHRIKEASKHGMDVCRAHGDLNQTNVLRDQDEIWLLDWEQSREDAPCLTDTVCVAVDRLWSDDPRNPARNYTKFKQEFLSQGEDTARDRVILALAFLGAAGFTPALAMIREGFA